MKYLSFLSTWPLQKLETLRFPAALSGECERLPPGRYRNLGIFGGLREERSPSKSIDIIGGIWCQALGVAFLALRGLLKVQFEIPYKKSHHSQFLKAWRINYTYVNNQANFIEIRIIFRQISINLAIFGRNKGNFREERIMFQWILSSSVVFEVF